MIIYKGQEPKKERRSGAAGTLPGVLQALWDGADHHDQAKRRVGMQQQQSQFDARMSAEEQAQKAHQAMREKEMAWEEEDRETERLGRKATAEMTASLIRGQRPPEIATPEAYGPSMPEVQGPSADGGRPLGVEARIADSERRKWDDYERWAADPNVSPEAKKMLFSQLSRESEKKMADAQWSSITRRFAQLAMPSKTMRGSDVMGLNPEDPEQAELLSNIQGMIDQREDAAGVSSLMAELEKEILLDARMLERRESNLEQMQMDLAKPNLNIEQKEAMLQVWQRFQRDPGADPDEMWNDFVDAQKVPVRDAKALRGSGGGGTTSPGPGAPTNPFAPVQKFSPHVSDTEGRQKAIGALDKKLEFGEPSESEIEARYNLENPAAGMQAGMASARSKTGTSSAESAGRASSARQDPAAVADKMGAGPRARAAAMKLDEKALDRLSTVVDEAETWEDAQDALADELVGMGYAGPHEVPSWLTSMLLKRWSAKGEAATRQEAADASGYGGAQQMADGMREGYRKQSRKDIKEEPLEVAPPSAKPKHIGEISGPGMGTPAKPTTWKRLPSEKQTNLRKQLLDAVEKAKRHDFHGALAPILRAAGVDLGSVPSALAKELREALKQKRAAARKAK